MSDATTARRRAALQAMVDSQRAKGVSLNAWARAGGVSESAVRGFLAGRTRSLTGGTYDRLAEAAGLPLTALLGEAAPSGTVPLVGGVDIESASLKRKHLLDGIVTRYLALLDRNGAGEWFMTIPDIPGFSAGGAKTVTGLLGVAAGVLLDHVEAMAEVGAVVSAPRQLEDLKADPAFSDDFASAEMIATVPLLPPAGQKVRAHLSMDRAVLAAIDAEAERLKMDRSAYLTAAARHLMAQG